MHCIEIDQLYYKYKRAENYSLEDISFSIEENDKFGILGPNGAGKTTLISLICGVLENQQGALRYKTGNKTLDIRGFQETLGFVPQEYAFYPELSPIQNLEYFGSFYNMNKTEINNRSFEILDKLGLGEVGHKKINTFSGGMKRRVNLAIGILHDPKVLILDEPTVGVDVQSKNAIHKYLSGLHASGATIIYSSHLLPEVESLCNNMALIEHGKLIALGPITKVLGDHNHQDLESLFISMTGESYRN